MKEVLAIIQMNKMESTKDALDVIGIPSITVYKASGRGKQRGLQILHPSPLASSDQKSMKYIPKRVISIMVEDEFVPAVVAVITKVNRTGNYGDGRIFICPLDESIRIRTGERGSVALS
jgi:nitrogen regulatory protein PII 2